MRVYYLNAEYEPNKHKIKKVWHSLSGVAKPEDTDRGKINVPYSVLEIDESYNPNLAIGLLKNNRRLLEDDETLLDRFYINNNGEIISNDTGQVVNVNPNPQKEAYKLSQLYGLTHEQLDTFVDGLSTMADYKEAFRKALHVILWLVKQTKLDE